MKRKLLVVVMILLVSLLYAQNVSIEQDEGGWKFLKDGENYPIYGVVWTHTPIGENNNYNLWGKKDEYIKQVIEIDMSLMKKIGVNTIRSFEMIPPRWIEYIYETYDITFAMNTMFGRYGVNIGGKWYPATDYSMTETQEFLIQETVDFVNAYKDVPGVVMFLVGNENNYGLAWQGSNEIENLPDEEKWREKSKFLYEAMGKAITEVKKITNKPVGIVNGDLGNLDIIASRVANMDFLATNVYRGKTTYNPYDPNSKSLFATVAEQFGKPVIISEFGSDALNAITQQEAQYDQAEIIRSQWHEIFQESYGKGKSQNALGGFVFSWMDEWWKLGGANTSKDLTVHNKNDGWRGEGYAFDSIYSDPNFGNMNEEWFGINAQSTKFYHGYKEKVNKRIPRAAYYVLGEVWQENMYVAEVDNIDTYFSSIDIGSAVGRASAVQIGDGGGDSAVSDIVTLQPILAGGVRVHGDEFADSDDRPFSYEQTVNIIADIKPSNELGARINVRGQFGALEEPLYYSYSDKVKKEASSTNIFKKRYPFQLYGASFLYKKPLFEIAGYFHDGYELGGHTDWVDKGDKFGLMQETFDYNQVDKDMSVAPFGVELSTKGQWLGGATIYVAPEAYKDARPSIFVNYFRTFNLGSLALSTGIVHQEEISKDIVTKGDLSTSDPQGYNDPLARKSSLMLGVQTPLDIVGLKGVLVGLNMTGLFSGAEWIGRKYSVGVNTDEPPYDHRTNEVGFMDTIGGKARLTTNINLSFLPAMTLWGQYAFQGAVAEGGGIISRNGSRLGDNGAPNKQEIMTGYSVFLGNFNLMFNALWRTPLVPALNTEIDDTIIVRDTIDDDFLIVHANRETIDLELIGTYDMTGATYFYEWDNVDREDALFAGSLGLVYTLYKGRTDALAFTAADGVTKYQRTEGLKTIWGLYSLNTRVISNFAPAQRIIITGNIGTYEGASTDPTVNSPENIFAQTYALMTGEAETITFQESYGGSVIYVYRQIEIGGNVQRNAFGPEDWHVEWGYQSPWQYAVKMAYHFDKVSVLNPSKVIYVQMRGRSYTELVNKAMEDNPSTTSTGAVTALNPLGGNSEGNYDYNRFEITLGYQLKF